MNASHVRVETLTTAGKTFRILMEYDGPTARAKTQIAFAFHSEHGRWGVIQHRPKPHNMPRVQEQRLAEDLDAVAMVVCYFGCPGST